MTELYGQVATLEAQLDKAVTALTDIRKNEGGSLTLYAHTRIQEGLGEIEEGERDVPLASVAHHGDPCRHCNVAHNDVPSGPCQARVAEIREEGPDNE